MSVGNLGLGVLVNPRMCPELDISLPLMRVTTPSRSVRHTAYSEYAGWYYSMVI